MIFQRKGANPIPSDSSSRPVAPPAGAEYVFDLTAEREGHTVGHLRVRFEGVVESGLRFRVASPQPR